MNISILSQKPGSNTSLYNELKKLFNNKDIKQFRALVAYISWSGISHFHKEMENFHDRKNGKINMILGLGETKDFIYTLRYLNQRLHKGLFRIFNSANKNYTFHPKVYFFKGKKRSIALIGSNNFTLGGTYYNSECLVKITYNRNNDIDFHNNIEQLWNLYNKPETPFKKSNIRKLTNSFLKNIDSKYNNYNISAQNRNTNKAKNLFGDIHIKNLTIDEPLGKYDYKDKKYQHEHSRSKRILYLEILKETGMDGTQVQIPSQVLNEFFKCNTSHKTIQFKWLNNEVRPAVLCIFGNHTFRVSINEIASFKRPLMIKFIKYNDSFFKLKPIIGKSYRNMISKCTNQTRNDSKKWLLINE